MAARKTNKADAAKSDAAKSETKDSDKAIEKAALESPISTTGAAPVFRADMGEGLPPQKKAGVE